jgi:uncharacterized caspase-like protein
VSALMRCLGLVLLLAAATLPVQAATHRLALVIGNDSYQHADVLRNARADARAVAASLQAIGFTVTLRQDVTLQQMKEALRNFKATVAGGDEVVFYFSGHGVQFGGTNYLIPVDLVPENEEQVADDSVGLQRVLDDLGDQKARFALAIIDACRDNPFKGSGRAIGKRGLAPVQAATGQMVLYSAGAGQEALDRLGNRDADPNGLFTRVLIKEIRKPGVPANQLLKNVSYQVVQLAKSVNHEQVPALYDQTIGDYYFVPAAAGAVAARAPVAAPSAASAGSVHVESADELEQEYWNRIKDSTDSSDFSDYQKQFPQGAHYGEASLELRRLKRAAHKNDVAASSNSGNAGQVTRSASLGVADAAPVPAAAAPASSKVAAGTYTGYSTSSLAPGQIARGQIIIASSGEFDYTSATGAKVHGSLDLTKPDDISGSGTVQQPRKFGIPLYRYPDGSSSTQLVIRAKVSNGKLVGRYSDAYETGDLVVDLTGSN